MTFQYLAITFFLLIMLGVAYNDRLTKTSKLLLFVLLGSGILFLLNPGLLDSVARYLGVSLGSDLVFYLTTMFVIYLAVSGYSRMLDANRKMVRLARYIALSNPRVPGKVNDHVAGSDV